MEAIKIINEQAAIIEINYEEMKLSLAETLLMYKGIVVTEESLKSCKEAQKELASTRVTLDNYRKNKKKELSKPIAAFEDQCKELIEMVEQAEAPIKEGIKVFDDIKKEEKRQKALELIQEVIKEQELNEKYAARLDVIDKYCNLTAKEKDVKDDLISRATTLKVEQDRESELIDIIKSTIELENVKLYQKMKFEDFKRYIDRGMTAKEVIAEIRFKADAIYLAENPPIIEKSIETQEFALEEPIVEPLNVPTIDDNKEMEQLYYAEYKIIGTHKRLLEVSKFLKDNNIEYKVVEQGEYE